jgi:hypothetical protein
MEVIYTSGLETGHNLLVSSDSFLAKTIQDFERNKWNHSGTIIKTCSGIWVFEATEHGAVFTPLSHYTNSGKSLLIQIPKKWKYENIADYDYWCHYWSYLGYQFGNLLFSQAIKYSSKWFNLWVRKNLGFYLFKKEFIWVGSKSDKKVICGKLSAMVQNKVLAIHPDFHEMAPRELVLSGEYTNYLLKW